MRRDRPPLQLESLESKTPLSGLKPALTPAAHVAVLPREIPSAKHLPISISASPGSSPGFIGPAAGAPRFRQFAPTEVDPNSPLINQQLGQANAEKIAASLGLKPKSVFSKIQYRKFTSGSGKGGDMIAALFLTIASQSLRTRVPIHRASISTGTQLKLHWGAMGLRCFRLRTFILLASARTRAPHRKS